MLSEKHIQDIGLFRGLPEPLIRLVREGSELLPRQGVGDVIFGAGEEADAIFFIVAPSHRDQTAAPARVRIDLPVIHSARPVRFERIVENEVFGEFEYFCAGMKVNPPSRDKRRLVRETRATLLAPANVIRIPLSVIGALMEQSAVFRQRLVSTAASRLRTALLSQIRRRHVDLDACLAEHLLDLAADYATTYENYAVFTTKISQDDIAADLGISRRALSERIGSWVEAGLIRTTPLILLDLHRLEQLQRIGVEDPLELIDSLFAAVMQTINAGNLSAGRAVALDFLRHFPTSPRLAFAAALASARSGQFEDAEAVLEAAGLAAPKGEELKDRILLGLVRPANLFTDALPGREDIFEAAHDDANGSPDAAGSSQLLREATFLASEVLSLRARLAKDRAVEDARPESARTAAELYLQAHEVQKRDDAYALVNAASLCSFAGDHLRARELAESALLHASGRGYWPLASRAEALLVLERPDEAVRAAAQAKATDPADGMLASTRRQLNRLLAGKPGADAVVEVLGVRTPLIYSGVMLGADQFDAQPGAIEQTIREEVAWFFRARRIGPVFGALARGSDLIIAEAALEAGCDLHVVLPFDVQAFVELSVTGDDAAGSEWRGRFDAVMNQARTVTVAQPGRPMARDLDISFRHGFRYAAAHAVERAGELQTQPLLLAVAAPGPGGSMAGTNADMADWLAQSRLMERILLPFRKARAAGTARPHHGFAPVVFCFPENESNLRRLIETVVAETTIADVVGLRERRIKDGRQGTVAVLRSLADAVRLAFALRASAMRRTELRSRIICDYGAVLSGSGEIDNDLLARMAGGGDFMGFPTNKVLAAAAFAREVQFSPIAGLTTVALGQRDQRSKENKRSKIVAAMGVYELRGGPG